MLSFQKTTYHVDDTFENRRTPRVRQAETFEMLMAAAEAEDTCPVWITERLSERERVWP